MLDRAFAPSPSQPVLAPAQDVAPLLAFVRLATPRLLTDFHRFSPPARGDIGLGMAGLPLRLGIELRDRRGQPVPQAAVYVWHHDPQGWSIEFDADDLDTVSRMWGWQFSDAQGVVGFRTVYPGQFRDGSVPLYLRIYLNDGVRVQARTDLCLRLPTDVQGPLRPIPVALPLPERAEPPRWIAGPAATVRQLPRLTFDPTSNALLGQLRLDLDT